MEASINSYAKDRVIDGIKILALTGFNLFENPELLKNEGRVELRLFLIILFKIRRVSQNELFSL